MTYKSKLNNILSKLNWITKLGTSKIREVEILEIPSEWEEFPGTEDKWVKLPFMEKELNITACLYKAKSGSIFSPHFHVNSSETILVRRGGVKIYTPKYVIELGENQSHTIERGLPHICKFKTFDDPNDTSLVEISWCPKMNGWDATFIK